MGDADTAQPKARYLMITRADEDAPELIQSDGSGG
jgi:hypothetical protein